jgi:hypothetical protein
MASGGGICGGNEVGVFGKAEVVIGAEGADPPVALERMSARASVEPGQGSEAVAAGELGQVVVEGWERRHGGDSRSGNEKIRSPLPRSAAGEG